jgi:V8-like Glu-specific endopeptidase
VIGVDDSRAAVDARRYPFRCVLRVHAAMADGTALAGTGFLVGPHTVLTAAHCLYDAARGGSAVSVRVGDARGLELQATDFGYLHGWSRDGDRGFDLGHVRLSHPVGDRLGFFGTRALGDAQLRRRFAVSGYPDDKHDDDQYQATGTIERPGARLLRYAIDTGKGQSGAPLFCIVDGVACAVGVHVAGTDAAESLNIAVRLDADRIADVRRWLA